MADRDTPTSSTPENLRPQTTPDEFRSRDYDLRTSTSLHEISLEQGRIIEKLNDMAKSFKDVGDKVDKLTTSVAVLDTKVTPLGPKVDAHNRLYWILIGATAILGMLVTGAWQWNRERFDRLIKILDNPAIERFVNKKPRGQ